MAGRGGFGFGASVIGRIGLLGEAEGGGAKAGWGLVEEDASG
jgi:hypothetical protein